VTTIAPERLAQAVGEAGAELGIRPAAETAERMLTFVREPMELFHRHLNWPAALNDSGLPVELSLKVEGPGSVALRSVVDPTDYRLDATGNLPRYVELSTARTGAATAEQAKVVRQLCQAHLDGVPPDFPSRLVHGLGFAADRERGSLYFRTGWLDGPGFAARLPEAAALAAEAGDLPERVEVAGYDFVAGELHRTKLYTWLPVRPGRLDGLGMAGDLFARRAGTVPQAAREHAVFLQTSGPGALRRRLFFFPGPWGWASPEGLRQLLTLLSGEYGVDLLPLIRFRQVLARHDIRLRLSLVSLADGPSATFYFLPVAPAVSTADVAWLYQSELARLHSLTGEAAPESPPAQDPAALLRSQRADGGWSGDPDLLATGHALRILAASPEVPGVVEALRRGTAYVDGLVVARDPYLAGLWLDARLAGGEPSRSATVDRAVDLLSRHRSTDLRTTAAAVAGLQAVLRSRGTPAWSR
jgi:hypothetical protein